MGEFGENRKGQNLETIISKLSKEQPNGKRNSFMLISGIDHSNVMFHIGAGGHESEGEDNDPDLFQCGKCKQMFTSLQKYLRHKAAKDCHQQAGQRSAASPVTNGEVLDSPDENNFINSPTKRKHERKGIARRVSNFSSEGEPVSPEASVVVPAQQAYNVAPAFPVQMEPPPPSSNYHDFSNPVVSISVAEALRSQSPVVVQPTRSFSPSWNGTNEQLENVNPPTMVTSVHSQLPPTPVVNPIVALSLRPPLQPSPRPILASPQMDQMWTTTRFTGIPMEAKSVVPQPAPPVTRSKKGFADPPPIVVHLKDRGRPVRPKETGLTEEELTDEIVTSSGQKVYRCKKCDKEFSFSSRLKRHLLVHTGARPFECPVCSRRFTQAVDLKRHMLRHSGQKPHVCHFCGKQYTRGDRLKVHLMSHAQEEKEDKPYNCSRCSACFFEAEELRLHVCELQDGTKASMEASEGDGGVKTDQNNAAVFTDNQAGESEHPNKFFRCDECNATFTKYNSLKSHLLKHTGEKKYQCEHCNKTFFSSSSLKIHVRVHTGDRPFKCKECPRKFSDPSNFNKHKRWHAKQRNLGTVSAALLPAGVSDSSLSPAEKGTTESPSTSGLTDELGEQSGVGHSVYTAFDGCPQEELRHNLFPDENQDMLVEESGGLKSSEDLLSMAPESTDTIVKYENEDE